LVRTRRRLKPKQNCKDRTVEQLTPGSFHEPIYREFYLHFVSGKVFNPKGDSFRLEPPRNKGWSTLYACASEKVEAVVDVTAEALIAAENRIECGRDVRSLDVKLGNAKALTVLGNIVGGAIIINGAALGGPWQPLNVIGT
jgi:hypothetical protein